MASGEGEFASGGDEKRRALVVFLGIALGFLALWVTNAMIRVPVGDLAIGNAAATVVFMGLPVIGLYWGGKLNWTPLRAVVVLLICLGVVAGLTAWAQSSALLSGVLQLARLGWPMAVGILISALVKDKNLLLPIAIVLATVDFLAVLSPVGTVKHGLQSAAVRPFFDALAFQVPKFGTASTAAQMGPADPLFLGMFFYAIHKFRMRSRATLLWMLPVLFLYLGVVIWFGSSSLFGIPLGALPALVPIGVVVVAVNWREFKMSASERAMTMFVLFACCALAIAAFVSWKKPVPDFERPPQAHMAPTELQTDLCRSPAA